MLWWNVYGTGQQVSVGRGTCPSLPAFQPAEDSLENRTCILALRRTALLFEDEEAIACKASRLVPALMMHGLGLFSSLWKILS
jgi:hypothetical protein